MSAALRQAAEAVVAFFGDDDEPSYDHAPRAYQRWRDRRNDLLAALDEALAASAAEEERARAAVETARGAAKRMNACDSSMVGSPPMPDLTPEPGMPFLASSFRGDTEGVPPPYPWRLLVPHEPQAERNHNQSLQRLRERGGLSASEMLAVMEDRPWRQMPERQAYRRLMEIADAG